MTSQEMRLPESPIVWVYKHIDEQARGEFLEAVDKAVWHATVDPGDATSRELVELVKSWVVSTRLSLSPNWLKNMSVDDSQGESFDEEHLRAAVGL